MPLTKKGEKILTRMTDQYGKKKALEIFNSMINSGKLTKVEKKKPRRKPKK